MIIFGYRRSHEALPLLRPLSLLSGFHLSQLPALIDFYLSHHFIHYLLKSKYSSRFRHTTEVFVPMSRPLPSLFPSVSQLSAAHGPLPFVLFEQLVFALGLALTCTSEHKKLTLSFSVRLSLYLLPLVLPLSLFLSLSLSRSLSLSLWSSLPAGVFRPLEHCCSIAALSYLSSTAHVPRCSPLVPGPWSGVPALLRASLGTALTHSLAILTRTCQREEH